MIMVDNLAKVQDIWERLRKNPGGFEKIAQDESFDVGSRSLRCQLAEPITRRMPTCEPSTHRGALSDCHPSTDCPDKGLRRPPLVSSRTGAGSDILPRRANHYKCSC